MSITYIAIDELAKEELHMVCRKHNINSTNLTIRQMVKAIKELDEQNAATAIGRFKRLPGTNKIAVNGNQFNSMYANGVRPTVEAVISKTTSSQPHVEDDAHVPLIDNQPEENEDLTLGGETVEPNQVSDIRGIRSESVILLETPTCHTPIPGPPSSMYTAVQGSAQRLYTPVQAPSAQTYTPIHGTTTQSYTPVQVETTQSYTLRKEERQQGMDIKPFSTPNYQNCHRLIKEIDKIGSLYNWSSRTKNLMTILKTDKDLLSEVNFSLAASWDENKRQLQERFGLSYERCIAMLNAFRREPMETAQNAVRRMFILLRTPVLGDQLSLKAQQVYITQCMRSILSQTAHGHFVQFWDRLGNKVSFPIIANVLDKVEMLAPTHTVPVNELACLDFCTPQMEALELNYAEKNGQSYKSRDSWQHQLEQRISGQEARLLGCEEKIVVQGKQLTLFEKSMDAKMDQILQSVTQGQTNQNDRRSGQRWPERKFGSKRADFKPADRPCRLCQQKLGDTYHHEKYCDNNRA